jgi:hypothetical protein
VVRGKTHLRLGRNLNQHRTTRRPRRRRHSRGTGVCAGRACRRAACSTPRPDRQQHGYRDGPRQTHDATCAKSSGRSTSLQSLHSAIGTQILLTGSQRSAHLSAQACEPCSALH